MAVSVLSLRQDLRCCQFSVSNLGDRSPGQRCIWYSASTVHWAVSPTPTVTHTHTDHADKEPQEEPQSWRSEAGRSPDLSCRVKPSWPSKETQPQVLCHVSSYIMLLLKLCFTYDINLIKLVSREQKSYQRALKTVQIHWSNVISRRWKNYVAT